MVEIFDCDVKCSSWVGKFLRITSPTVEIWLDAEREFSSDKDKWNFMFQTYLDGSLPDRDQENLLMLLTQIKDNQEVYIDKCQYSLEELTAVDFL